MSQLLSSVVEDVRIGVIRTAARCRSNLGLATTVLSVLIYPVLAVARVQSVAAVGTTTFVIDGNRIYARLSFVRPDGSRQAAAGFFLYPFDRLLSTNFCEGLSALSFR
jgi:hypothetical protein